MLENNERLVKKDKLRPKVVLIEVKREKTFNSLMRAYYDISDAGGKIIGNFTLELTYSWPEFRDIWRNTAANEIVVPPQEVMITTITISEEHQNTGFGKSTYLELLRLLGTVPLISGNTLTGYNDTENGSYKIWLSLVRDKRAVEVSKDGELAGFISIPIGYLGSTGELVDKYLSNH